MEKTDFEYYCDMFAGKEITDISEFDSCEIKARAFVDKITFGRITQMSDDVKNAVCAVCEEISAMEGKEGIKSESNDGYSVVYDVENDSFLRYKRAAEMFLPAELLYRGI